MTMQLFVLTFVLATGAASAEDAKCKWSDQKNGCEFSMDAAKDFPTNTKFGKMLRHEVDKQACMKKNESACSGDCAWAKYKGVCEYADAQKTKAVMTEVLGTAVSSCSNMMKYYMDLAGPRCENLDTNETCSAIEHCSWRETPTREGAPNTSIRLAGDVCKELPVRPGRCTMVATKVFCGRSVEDKGFNGYYTSCSAWTLNVTEYAACMSNLGACANLYTEEAYDLKKNTTKSAAYDHKLLNKACAVEKTCKEYADVYLSYLTPGTKEQELEERPHCAYFSDSTTCKDAVGCHWAAYSKNRDASLNMSSMAECKEKRDVLSRWSNEEAPDCYIKKMNDIKRPGKDEASKLALADAEDKCKAYTTVKDQDGCNADTNCKWSVEKSCNDTVDLGNAPSSESPGECEYLDLNDRDTPEGKAADKEQFKLLYGEGEEETAAHDLILSCEAVKEKSTCQNAALTAADKLMLDGPPATTPTPGSATGNSTDQTGVASGALSRMPSIRVFCGLLFTFVYMVLS